MTQTKRIRLLLSYDGTNYKGWQRQPQYKTIQGLLEQALQTILQTPITTVGSGRTDAGVHALEQNLHFDYPANKSTPKDLPFAINSILPKDIVVQRSWVVDNNFHALHSATNKLYEYRIIQSEYPNPLKRHHAWWISNKINPPLDVSLLNQLSSVIIGEHDFKSFQSTGTDVPHTIRTILESKWSQEKNEIIYQIRGNGFLKQMVRNIVGTFIKLHMKHVKNNTDTITNATSELEKILTEKDRQLAAAPAPAEGLYLKSVTY